MIDFEISGSCSFGLMQSLAKIGMDKQESFSLEIEKGPLFVILEELTPDMKCLLHIGCSADIRPPSFEYTLKHRDIRNKMLTFSYRRSLLQKIFINKDWLHDCCGLRDIESVARELSNLQNCTEEVILLCTRKNNDGINRSFGLEIMLKGENPPLIIGMGNVQKIEKLLGGSLSVKKEILESNYWNWNMEEIYGLTKEMYLLYQHAAPQFGERIPVRKKLEIPQ